MNLLQNKNQKQCGDVLFMINYSKLSYKIKRKVLTFSNKISKNLSRPTYKFITQMIYGILENQTVLLSDISRALKENISLKKTIERLSNNLKAFDKHNKGIKALDRGYDNKKFYKHFIRSLPLLTPPSSSKWGISTATRLDKFF
jgi:hypothetical protein